MNSLLYHLSHHPSFWDPYWPTLALCIFAAIAAVIAVRTLSATEKSADAAKKSAEVALLNAQAVINSERAWIMMELQWAPLGPKIVHGSAIIMGAGERKTTANIRFTYTNEGRTMAWIDEKLACFQIVKELPKQPNLSNLELIDSEPEWIAPRTEREGRGYFFKDCALTAEGQETLGEISVVWGIIRYRDALSDSHETTFAFRVCPDYTFQRIAVLTEYNKTS